MSPASTLARKESAGTILNLQGFLQPLRGFRVRFFELAPLALRDLQGVLPEHLLNIPSSSFHQVPIHGKGSQDGAAHGEEAIDEIETGEAFQALFQEQPR